MGPQVICLGRISQAHIHIRCGMCRALWPQGGCTRQRHIDEPFFVPLRGKLQLQDRWARLEIPSCDRWVYEIKHGRVRNCNFNSMCDNAWFFGVVFLMDWGRTFVLSFFYSLQVLMGFQDFIAGLPSKGRFPPSIGSGDLLGSRPAAGSSWRGAGPGKRGGWRTKTRPPGGETMEVNQAVSLVCPTPNEQKSLRRSTYQSETGVPKRHPDAAGKPG